MIEPSFAKKASRESLERLHLQENPEVASALAKAEAGKPLLVMRLDAPGKGYYLVPWKREARIVLLVQIDAQDGIMSSMVIPKRPLDDITISPEQAKAAVSSQLGMPVTGEPVLVWQPSRESSSPFQPFYQVPVPGGNVYVSTDSAVYSSLTPFGKGG